MELRQSYFMLATVVGGVFGALVLGLSPASAASEAQNLVDPALRAMP